MPAKENQWDSLKDANSIILTLNYVEFEKQFDVIAKQYTIFKQHTPDIMANQKWFYASKMADPEFLINRNHHKFIPVTMLPINCGYGIATFANLPLGAIFCYKESTRYRGGWGRDINSSAHIEQIGREQVKDGKLINPWVEKDCPEDFDYFNGNKTLAPAIGREKSDAPDRRKTLNYDLWLKSWPLPPNINKNELIIVEPVKENGKTLIKYEGRSFEGNLVSGTYDPGKELIPFDIGNLRPLKDKLFELVTGYHHAPYGNKAKARKTALDLYDHLVRRWDRVLEAVKLDRPIAYKTTVGKRNRTNADDFSFFKLRHGRRAKNKHQLERQSLKYNEAALAPKHLNTNLKRSNFDLLYNPKPGDFDLSEFSHLIITEGAVGKAALGNVLWTVTMQERFLKNYNHYLPIYIYDHKKGTHIPVPLENLKVIHALKRLLPLFTQDQLDTDFYYLLLEDGQDKFTSLTTKDGIVKACEKILTLENLELAFKQVNKDPLKVQLLLEYMSSNVLKTCPLELIQKLKIHFANDSHWSEVINHKIEGNIFTSLSLAVKNSNFGELKSIIENNPVDEIKKCSPKLSEEIRTFLLSEGKYSLLSLFDKARGEWTKRYNNKAPSVYAAEAKDYEQVLEIAALREKFADWKDKCTFEEYQKKDGIQFHSLGFALTNAAENGRWDVVNALITQHDMTHYDFFVDEFTAVHFAILANRLDILKTMHDNQRLDAEVMLVEQKTKITKQTPFQLAIETPDREDIAIFLLKAGSSYDFLIDMDVADAHFSKRLSLLFQHLDLPLIKNQIAKLAPKILNHNNEELILRFLERKEVENYINADANLKAKFSIYLTKALYNAEKIAQENIALANVPVFIPKLPPIKPKKAVDKTKKVQVNVINNPEPKIQNQANINATAEKIKLVEAFLALHRKDYYSGIFGSLFKRTKLKRFYKNSPPPASELNIKNLIAHARDLGLFGTKNRSRCKLEELGIMDNNGIVLNKNFK